MSFNSYSELEKHGVRGVDIIPSISITWTEDPVFYHRIYTSQVSYVIHDTFLLRTVKHNILSS